MDQNKYLEKAVYNETVCRHLKKETRFYDWVVTTAFYSAIFYTRHKLIPFEKDLKSGRKVKFNDFETLYENFSGNLNRHNYQVLVVDENHPEIGVKYKQLYEMANNSRYNDFNVGNNKALRAWKCLSVIKSYCIK